MIQKLLNRYGFYRINQLKVGGMCGCCGKRVPKLIWFDNGDGWDDIGICDECLKED